MRQVINWNTRWSFSQEAETVPLEMPGHWYLVNLPHTWNAIDGMDGGNDFYRGTCYYAKTLNMSDLPQADVYYLEFEAVNSSGDLYVNGRHMGHHDGGYSTFRVNITDALCDGKNLVVVAVDNSKVDDVYPFSADFTFYGGLYRDVSIIAVTKSHLDLDIYGGCGVAVDSEVETVEYEESEGETGNEINFEVTGAKFHVRTFVDNAEEGQTLAVEVLDADGHAAATWTDFVNTESDAYDLLPHEGEFSFPWDEAAKGVRVNDFTLCVDDVHLWDGIKDPYLYTVKVTLKDAAGNELDQVSVRHGVRTFSIDPDKGFFLNGRSYPLHGGARHQDRIGLGNALTKKEHDEDMDIILEMGCNSIRLAHYQHARYFYDLCDEKGLVVWAEIPYISIHLPKARKNSVSQMKELVIQNYNHSSIVVWGISNEISLGGLNADVEENHDILNDLIHAMDKTRLTTMAFESHCPRDSRLHLIPDCLSYNLYRGWYDGKVEETGPWLDEFHAQYPDVPVGISEYGAEASLNFHNDKPQVNDYSEEYQAVYHESCIRQLSARPYIWSTYIWNLFDFGSDMKMEGGENGQNHKGLVNIARTYKKDSYYAYKAWLSEVPFVHICSKRFIDRVGDTIDIKVYSNQPSVTLYVNGEKFAVNGDENMFFHFRDVPLKGDLCVRAEAGEACDLAAFRKVAEPNLEYRFADKAVLLNWFEITVVDGYYSLLSPYGIIAKSPEATALTEDMFSRLITALTAGGGRGIPAKLLEGLNILRILQFAKDANADVTKEELISLNQALNKVPMPE